MNCTLFERWLDEGQPAGPEAEARAHARSCDSCARALAAAAALEPLLASEIAPAPDGFTARVMERIGRPPALVPALPAAGALPWWIRAAMDPATVLAALLAALLAWRGNVLWSLAAAGAAETARSASQALAEAGGTALMVTGLGLLGDRPVQPGLDLGLMCLALLAVPSLYRGTLRVASRASSLPRALTRA